MSTTAYTAFGIPMQRRDTRRRLVLVIYGALAVICGVTFAAMRTTPWAFSWGIYAAMAVSIFVFGGQGRYGLIKPFVNKAPRPESPMVDAITLQLAPLRVGTPDESDWRNDERELARRDRAHYLAYQPLSMVWLFILLLGSWANRRPQWISQTVVLQIILGLALVSSVLVLTLPSAIILWTEPDMDVEQ